MVKLTKEIHLNLWSIGSKAFAETAAFYLYCLSDLLSLAPPPLHVSDWSLSLLTYIYRGVFFCCYLLYLHECVCTCTCVCERSKQFHISATQSFIRQLRYDQDLSCLHSLIHVTGKLI